MILYHGTSEEVGRDALKNGLRPRIATGKSNWKHTIESNPSLVYLTTCYAGYYALQAIKCGDRADMKKKKIAIVEVDSSLLAAEWMRPDEDLIGCSLLDAAKQGYVMRGAKRDWDLIEHTRYARRNIDRWGDRWTESVKFMGTCAYKGTIPPAAIRRVSFVQLSKALFATVALMQPAITPMNFKVMGHYYALLTDWLMGAKVTAEQYLCAQMSVCGSTLSFEQVKGMMGEQLANDAVKQIAPQLADQSGIEVLNGGAR